MMETIEIKNDFIIVSCAIRGYNGFVAKVCSKLGHQMLAADILVFNIRNLSKNDRKTIDLYS